MRFLSALLLFFPLVHAEAVYSGFSLIPHIADGGGIQMEFTLTNLDDTPSTVGLNYYDDNGNPLSITTNAGLSGCVGGTLAPHASCTIRTAGNSIPQVQGWAGIYTQGNVGASAIFRVSTAPWTGSEVMIPATPARNNRFSLALDQRDSAVIGLAIVNPLATNIAVTVTFRGEDGALIVADTFNMGSRAHRSIVPSSSYPATAGKRGTIDISTTGTHLSVLALRFGPSAISSIEPLVSSKWSDMDNGCPGCWDY
jgi:hypothetical protein